MEQNIDKPETSNSKQKKMISRYCFVLVLVCLSTYFLGWLLTQRDGPLRYSDVIFFIPCIISWVITGVLVVIGFSIQLKLFDRWRDLAGIRHKIAVLGTFLFFLAVGFNLLFLCGWRYPPSMNKVVFPGKGYTAVDANYGHVIALKEDGSIVEFLRGIDRWDTPKGNDYASISAGGDFCLALRKDGSIIAWGDVSEYNQKVFDVPDGNDFTAIAAGCSHCLALKKDGSIVAWGPDKHYRDVDNIPEGNDYVAIDVNIYNLALKKDGSVYKWGGGYVSYFKFINKKLGDDCISIDYDSAVVGIKSDGSIAVWTNTDLGEIVTEVPKGNDFIDVAVGGGSHGLALKKDGSIVAWGYNGFGQAYAPKGKKYKAVAADEYRSIAIDNEGRIIGWGIKGLGKLAKRKRTGN